MGSKRRRGEGLARCGIIGIGTAYGLGLLLYAGARPRAGELTGLLELVNNFAPWWYAPVPAMVLTGLGLRSRALTLAGLASAAAFGMTWGPLFAPRAETAAASGPSLTVMTLNVLYENPKHAELAAAIEAEDPDVVALQELEEDAAADLAQALGTRYPYRALHPARESGAGVLSRYPLRDVEVIQLSDGKHLVQRLAVDAPGGPLTLFNIQLPLPRFVWSEQRLGPLRLPIGYDSEPRSAEIRRLTDLVDGTAGPVLVMGDFNMTEYSPDYRRMRARLGDAYRAVGQGFGHTFPRFGSFPRRLPAPWPVLRLDYVWHSAELRPLAAHVGPSGRSDHHPVVVRFARADGPAS